MIANFNTIATKQSPDNMAIFNPNAAARGDVSIHAELHHLSHIAYAVPSERVKRLLPSAFQPEIVRVDGCEMALVSITSCLDAQRDGSGAFEQTTYRLHVRRGENPASWLLGTAVGSLSAVGMRQLWPMPWHLGAMEFQARVGKEEARYQDYRLITQSQWVNAYWEIADTGRFLDDDPLLRALNIHTITDHFERRDGSAGSRITRMERLDMTHGKLVACRCDLLERLGLVSREALSHPALVALQRNVACRLDAPQSNISSTPGNPSAITAQTCDLRRGH